MHKFRYYSAHDSTLNALLVAFDAINDSNHSWPPFAADLIIELWKSNEKSHDNKDSNYFIKLIYCGEVTNPVHFIGQQFSILISNRLSYF